MHNLYDANKCERYKVAEMKKYKDMSKDELLTLKAALMEEYKEEQAKGLSLNMARGKPGFAQLALSMQMLDEINSKSDMRTLLGMIQETMEIWMVSESVVSLWQT